MGRVYGKLSNEVLSMKGIYRSTNIIGIAVPVVVLCATGLSGICISDGGGGAEFEYHETRML